MTPPPRPFRIFAYSGASNWSLTLIPISRPSRARRVFSLALLAALALGASGCGRKGDLEPPPDASAVQKQADSSQPQLHKKIPKIAPAKTPFVLDPLL